MYPSSNCLRVRDDVEWPRDRPVHTPVVFFASSVSWTPADLLGRCVLGMAAFRLRPARLSLIRPEPDSVLCRVGNSTTPIRPSTNPHRETRRDPSARAGGANPTCARRPTGHGRYGRLWSRGGDKVQDRACTGVPQFIVIPFLAIDGIVCVCYLHA